MEEQLPLWLYWLCLSRAWKRRLIPGFPGSRKSALNRVSYQRKTIGWRRDPKWVSHLINSHHCYLPFICQLLWLVHNLLKRVSLPKVATTTCTEWRLWMQSETQVIFPFSVITHYVFIEQMRDSPSARTLISKSINFAYIIDIFQVSSFNYR